MRLAEFSVVLTTPITPRYMKKHILIRGLKTKEHYEYICLFYNPKQILPANWWKRRAHFCFGYDAKEKPLLIPEPECVSFSVDDEGNKTLCHDTMQPPNILLDIHGGSARRPLSTDEPPPPTRRVFFTL